MTVLIASNNYIVLNIYFYDLNIIFHIFFLNSIHQDFAKHKSINLSCISDPVTETGILNGIDFNIKDGTTWSTRLATCKVTDYEIIRSQKNYQVICPVFPLQQTSSAYTVYISEWYCEITPSHGILLGKLPPLLYFLPLLGHVWLYKIRKSWSSHH